MMKSTNTYPLITSIASRVTVARMAAIRTAKRAAVVPIVDPSPTLEVCRSLVVLLIIGGYCYQYITSTTTSLPINNLVRIILYNIQNTITLFFVLAGTLSFLPIARAILRRQGVYPIWGIVIRRIVRIIPVYFIAIVIVWILHYNEQPDQWLSLIEHLSFMQTFSTRNIFQIIGPAWVLSLEIWFSLFIACVAPFIYLCCTPFRKQTSRAIALFILIVLLILLGIGYKAWLYSSPYLPASSPVLYYSLPSRFDNFAFGMLLAAILAKYERHKKHLLYGFVIIIIALGLAVGTCFYSYYYLPDLGQNIYYFCQTMWELIGFLILTSIAVAMDTSLFPGKKKRRSYLWHYFGSISYAMFMWYEPMFTWLNSYFIGRSWLFFGLSLVSFILILLVIASMQYYIMEYPISFLSHLFTQEGVLHSRYLEPH